MGVAFVDGTSGMISGGLAATGLGFGTCVFANAALGGVTYTAEQLIQGNQKTVNGMIGSIVAGGCRGAIGGEGANGDILVNNYKAIGKKLPKYMARAAADNYAAKVVIRRTAAQAAIRTEE